jgi:hypothetical protein
MGAHIPAVEPARLYVLAAKYRCDLGVARNATAIRLTLPTRGAAFAGREALAVAGAAGRPGARSPGPAGGSG